MLYIKIEPDRNGAHETQMFFDSNIKPLEGWAEVSNGMELPETMPYVNVEAEGGIVTKLSPGQVPPVPAPGPESDPDAEQSVTAQMLAQAYLEGVQGA